MDAMGGVHIKATITYSDNTTDVDEDQSKFTISEGSNQNISGVYTIQGIDKLVLSNSDNKDTTTKTRNLSITYGGVTNTVSVT
jgi:hypothetical protein